jgi:hypothetical protein
MAHKIIEAVIENGKLTQIEKQLPKGTLKVHIIYDTEEKTSQGVSTTAVVKETAGIYKGIDVETESQKLRGEWERNVRN